MNGLVKANERKLLFWWVVMLLLILGVITTITGCNSGWAVANLIITPVDKNNSVYTIIVDQDSTEHWYDKAIYTEENYCFKHHIWEDVRKKNSE